MELYKRLACAKAYSFEGRQTVNLDTNKIDDAVLALLMLGLHDGARAES